MQMTMSTDYAVRILMYMAEHKRMVNSFELSESLDISQSYIFKVMQHLNKADIVSIIKGARGGYNLAKKASEISMFDIMSAIEKTMMLNKEMEKDNYGELKGAKYSGYNFYKHLQEEFERILKETSLENLGEYMKKVRH